jgi:NDP-sugar pyrophosphorylase family protein
MPSSRVEWIIGGYFFFQREFLSYLSTDESCVLERAPLVNLAEDGQLAMFKHDGFWACMDTQRDMDHLNSLWASGQAPWAPPARPGPSAPGRLPAAASTETPVTRAAGANAALVPSV